MLITFVAWKIPEGATFPEIEPLEFFSTKFSTLWYMNDMSKKWKSNVVFHAYYQRLKVSIESFPCMTLHTLHQYRPLEKFHVELHFIYITAHRDESR
jgi:myosin-crossreactive antigen